MTKQIKLLQLLWALIKIFFRKGNIYIFYHVCHPNSHDCPMEAKGVEM